MAGVVPVVGEAAKAGKLGVKALELVDKVDDVAEVAAITTKGAKDGVDSIKDAAKHSGDGGAYQGSIKSIDTGDLEVIDTRTPDVANSEWIDRGYDKAPYNPEFEVKVVKAGNEKYVRVFSYNADGTSNKLGGWLMKESDIEGLTPSQIADKYALPSQPTHICDVNVRPDFNLQTGIAN